MKLTLKRIADNIILEDCPIDETDKKETEKIPKPYLSSIVNLTQSELLHGLGERIVAVESTVFLAKQFELMKGYLDFLMPSTNKAMLQQFYDQVRFIN